MKRLIIPFLLLATMARAQTPEEQILRLVLEGQRHYERSYRPGMMQCANDIELLLQEHATTMRKEDRLEYTADLLRLRGNWHYENGNYDSASFRKAEQYYLQALKIYQENSFFSGDCNAEIVLHQELAQLYYRTRDYQAALREVVIVLDSAKKYGPGFLDEEKELDMPAQKAMCLARMGDRSALDIISHEVSLYPKNSAGYTEALRKKGKILMLLGDTLCAQKALPLYRQYFDHKKKEALATLSGMTAGERQDYWMRMRPFLTDCYQLEDADPAFLYNVTLFSKGLLLQLNRLSGEGPASKAALASLQHDWQQIQRRLPKDGCAVEFVQYELRGEQRMGALVLRPQGRPQWVAMPAPDSLYGHRIGHSTVRQRLHSTDGYVKNELYRDSALIQMIWHPALREAIAPCRRLYFAPDGYLHQLAIEYLPGQSLDSMRMYRLTSTRRLMERASLRTDKALIIGGVNYDSGTSSAASPAENDSNAYRHFRDGGAYFCWLPGTLAEADTILSQRHRDDDTLLWGSDATEENFRIMAPGFPIINISTHGCFLGGDCDDGSTDLKPALGDEIMEQSVIAFAGANESLADPLFDSRHYDGLLSAREVSEMDLSQTDLVVLSACQTGMGEVTADGVYGMQRGLKNAGVGMMAVSLWSVDDQATMLLITRFQQLLAEGMPAAEAFALSREELASTAVPQLRRPQHGAKRSPSTQATYALPQFQNAFILIDAIE